MSATVKRMATIPLDRMICSLVGVMLQLSFGVVR
jgi:hypothetical protein